MGCDPAGLAMDALTVCASAIPDQLQLKVKRHDHWSESARLWTVKIGPPSAKKSPIQNAAEKPLKRIDAELYKEYLKELKAWQEQKEDDRDERPICKRKRVMMPQPRRCRMSCMITQRGLWVATMSFLGCLVALRNMVAKAAARIERFGYVATMAVHIQWIGLGGAASILQMLPFV